MPDTYEFFEKDGAKFRRRVSNGFVGIDDVKTKAGWEPYKGDQLAPVYYGDQITAEQAGEGDALFRRAAKFAADRHTGQFRGDGKTPYIQHPIQVARILREEAGITDPDVLAAAALHDVLEDTATTHAELVELFGQAVADMVLELTDKPGLKSADRKAAQVAKAPTYSDGASMVKIADKTANLRDAVANRPVDWSDEHVAAYFDSAARVIDSIRDVHPVLRQIFKVAHHAGHGTRSACVKI